jgi:uncharacterized membrane protein
VTDTVPTRNLPTTTAQRQVGGPGSTPRLLVSAAAGIVVGLAVGVPAKWQLGLLAGWIAGAMTQNAWLWLTIRSMDPQQTAAHAVREDPGRAITDVAVLIAAVASLGAVALVISSTNQTHGLAKAIQVAATVLSVVSAWLLVHLSYTTRYARLYYTGEDGGIDFNDKTPPRYVEFAYVAFTVGMTFQVSDTNVQHKDIRTTILHHALLSYLFGAVIVATMINLLAGLSK